MDVSLAAEECRGLEADWGWYHAVPGAEGGRGRVFRRYGGRSWRVLQRATERRGRDGGDGVCDAVQGWTAVVVVCGLQWVTEVA